MSCGDGTICLCASTQFASDSEAEDVADDIEEDEEDEAPKPVKKTGRAAVLK